MLMAPGTLASNRYMTFMGAWGEPVSFDDATLLTKVRKGTFVIVVGSAGWADGSHVVIVASGATVGWLLNEPEVEARP